MDIRVLEGRFAVVRLNPADPIPAWFRHGSFSSVTRTRCELSLVCEEGGVPDDVRSERGFRALAVAGPLDFSLVGLLAALASALAGAGVALLAISTYDTDYLLVREPELGKAVQAIEAGGFRVSSGTA